MTYIYGIGRSSARAILSEAGIDYDLKVKDWNDDQLGAVRKIIGTEYKVEGELRSSVQMNIKRLMDIGCYRGIQENLAVAKAGGQVAGRTRKDIESQSDTPVITAKNAAQLNQVVTDLLEGAVSDTTEESKGK